MSRAQYERDYDAIDLPRLTGRYNVLDHLDGLEAELTPDCPFQMWHLIRACRQLMAERDGYRQALADALARKGAA